MTRVPALPWKRLESVDAATELTVMASRLPLRSHLHLPGFLTATLRIRRQLAEAPGVVGYALDAKLSAKTLWTVSAWRLAASTWRRSPPPIHTVEMSTGSVRT